MGWEEKLLVLPAFLRDGGPAGGPADVAAALALTGHFLETRLAPTLPTGAAGGTGAGSGGDAGGGRGQPFERARRILVRGTRSWKLSYGMHVYRVLTSRFRLGCSLTGREAEPRWNEVGQCCVIRQRPQ